LRFRIRGNCGGLENEGLTNTPVDVLSIQFDIYYFYIHTRSMRLNKLIYTIANVARKAGYSFNEAVDVRVVAMKKEIEKIGKIEFKIEQYPDGSWAAESTNFDGIMTGGSSTEHMSSMIKDAVFTYFEIPPHLCNDALLKGDNEPVTVKQNVYA